MPQVVEKLVVEIVRQRPRSEEAPTLAEEASDVRDFMLHALGDPREVDFRVTVLSRQELPGTELWEIPHAY